jgi:hypothetical protein
MTGITRVGFWTKVAVFSPTVVSHLLKVSLNNVGMRSVRNESWLDLEYQSG